MLKSWFNTNCTNRKKKQTNVNQYKLFVFTFNFID